MKKLSKLLNRINFPKLSFLQFLVWVYIFFIPFWPKLPLKTITYTYIAVRYEDLFMAFITLVFGLYLIFKKIELPKNPFNILIPLYWIVVIISALVGFYHYKSVESLQLILLHAFRRVEYMIVFFIENVYQRLSLGYPWVLHLVLPKE